jgi:hypothetical protein
MKRRKRNLKRLSIIKYKYQLIILQPTLDNRHKLTTKQLNKIIISLIPRIIRQNKPTKLSLSKLIKLLMRRMKNKKTKYSIYLKSL